MAADLSTLYAVVFNGSGGLELCFSFDDPRRLAVYVTHRQALGELFLLAGQILARGNDVPEGSFQIHEYGLQGRHPISLGRVSGV